MKKKVFRERYSNNGFTFEVDHVDGYKPGAIEKIVDKIKKENTKKTSKKKEEK